MTWRDLTVEVLRLLAWEAARLYEETLDPRYLASERTYRAEITRRHQEASQQQEVAQ